MGKKLGKLPAFVDTLLPGQNDNVLELDALWSFVGAKVQTFWLWVALCRRSRQIVAWTLGDRSEQSALTLRAALPKDYRRCATRSVLWKAYRAVFLARTHRCCRKREGETCHVERWFGTLRTRLSRLVRRAYSFSKDAEKHLDAIHLFITAYHLALQQKAIIR